MEPIHPRLRFWFEVSEVLAEAAAEAGKNLQRHLRPRRKGSFETRRPGEDTPMWNALAEMIARELKPYGSKVRLARYLGIPKQRLYDYLKNPTRLPDAEILLQLLNWLATKQAGRDLSL